MVHYQLTRNPSKLHQATSYSDLEVPVPTEALQESQVKSCRSDVALCYSPETAAAASTHSQQVLHHQSTVQLLPAIKKIQD